MAIRGRELLTTEQRKEFYLLSNELSEWELGTFFLLSPHDIEIVERHRRDHNRLGFAVQLCIIRFTGRTITDFESIPPSIIQFTSNQIKVNSNEFHLYASRENTLWDHLKEIRDEYGYQAFTTREYRLLLIHLFNYAMENGNSIHLINVAISELKKAKILLPAITTIERAVWEARLRAESKIYKILNKSLKIEQKSKIDEMLKPMDDQEKTRLGWLRENTGQSSPESFLKVIERLEYIRELQLDIDVTGIHPNRLRQLSRIGARYEPHSLRRFKDAKRYGIIVVYLLELSQDLIDLAFEIHDRQIRILQSKGRKAQEEKQKQNAKSINEKVVHFASLGSALISARNENADPFKELEKIMAWDKIVESIEQAKQLARPIDYDYLDLLEKKFFRLRKYTPTLISALQFKATKSAKPLLKALDTIKEMNETGKRKVPENAPLNFISNRWQKHVYDSDGNINRHYYEMAALTELRNHVRSGNVSIVGSRQHKDFDEYIISKNDWNNSQKQSLLAVSLSIDDFLEERMKSLDHRLKWISKNITELDGINIEKGKLQVDRLEKDVPEEAKKLSMTLYSMVPRIKLTDLLIEVSNWTNFDQQFIHTSSNKAPNDKERTIVLAALMAMGTNIGLTKMAEATPGISYRQMANVTQWRMYEDAMNKAQSTLVNFHHKREFTNHWGDGTTSSSDGMRVQVGVSSLHAEHNPHYGTGKGATIYRFVSDQYSSFYAKVINTNARDAIHVIDGLLHHETDLEIEEHYTDTAGYTDQVFGLTHLLGFKFAPRLRDISDAKLYTIQKASEYPKIESILKGQINTKIIRDNYDDVLRLAHSIREGKVSAALIMGKLGSYARQNSLATALREIGRIEKTIFIMDYISDEALRRRIQKGLNKGEAMNALARAIFFGKHGELRERAIQDQLQRASALNIIINAISVWNTIYLGEATKKLKIKGQLNEELLSHISPLGWEHINFLGEYKFDINFHHSLEKLRPLDEKI